MDNVTYLSMPAVDVFKAMLVEANPGDDEALDVLARWSTGTVDAINSQYTLTSNAISTDGDIGQYTGAVTFAYQKRNLNALMPYPFVFPWAYPTNFATIQTFFQENFNIVFEEGEFTVNGNSVTTALNMLDVIDADPDPTTGQVTFVAQATSGRFAQGSTFSLCCTAQGVQVPLATLLALTTIPDLGLLTDH